MGNNNLVTDDSLGVFDCNLDFSQTIRTILKMIDTQTLLQMM